MLGSPRLAEAVSSAELFPIPTRSSFTADGTPKKTRLTDYVFRCKHGKWRKAKEKEVFKETTTNYDVSSRRVCAITSFKGVFFVFFFPEINLSFALLLCVLCPAAKIFCFYDWLNFLLHLGWVPKHRANDVTSQHRAVRRLLRIFGSGSRNRD